MISINRLFKFAVQDIGRNFGLSFMTVLILVLTILSVNALLSVQIITDKAVEMVKNQVNVSVYFNPDASANDVQKIQKYVLSFDEVVDARLESSDEVLASFRQRHNLSPDILSALSELDQNPFGPTMVIKTKEPSDYKKITQALNVPEYKGIIEAKSFDEHSGAIDKIQNITSRAESFVLGLVVLFVIFSFLIVFNMVRAAIHSQRAEIAIKRLVGASGWFISGPYFIASFIFSLFSLFVSLLIIYISFRFIDPYLSSIFTDGFSLTNYYNSHILYLFGPQFLSVLILTSVSTVFAMRKQLQV